MSKVLTIRDPSTGTLIAEGLLESKEDKNSALARLYRKVLGPEAPEQVVLSSSVWLDDREPSDKLTRDWGGFGLVVLGPKNNPALEKSRLVLARLSELTPSSRMEIPIGKVELEMIKQGKMSNVVIPVNPGGAPGVGDRVTFRKSVSDPFGEPILAPKSESLSVDLTEVRKEGRRWGGQEIYYIAWDPGQVRKLRKDGAEDRAMSEQSPR